MRRFFFVSCTIFLVQHCFPLFAEDSFPIVDTDQTGTIEAKSNDGYTGFEKQYFAAIGNSQLSNLFLFSVNRFIRRADYATEVDSGTILDNLGARWVWDQDSFSVNHIGHPYQGSFYYIAGRTNGLSFAESALLTMGNSICWELFYESERPSINDLIGTSLGGIAVGEMLHRLYLDANDRGFPASFLISPMDAFNTVVTGKRPPHHGSGVNSSEILLETGFISTRKQFDEHRDDEGNDGLSVNAGFRIVYGDPFGHETSTPFSHFEQEGSMILSRDYYSFMFYSDGLLFSRALDCDDTTRTTLGLSLHYDLIYSTDVNFYNNSFTLTLKHLRRLPRRSFVDIRAHVGFMPIAASDYIFLRYGNAPSPAGDEERRDYDIGMGPAMKVALGIGNRTLGKMEVEYKLYGLYTIPSSVPEEGSTGTTIFSILNVAYEHELWYKIATGLSVNYFRKFGNYDEAPDIDESAFSISCFLRYLLI